MSRIENSIKNIKYSFIGQITSFAFSFIARMIFVQTLNKVYLGLNGLFTNILLILSLAELGVGATIVYSMYQPLAKKDEKKISALMNLYKKSYMAIGITILVLGVSLTPFLPFFIKDMPDVSNLKFIYVLYVINSASTYFFIYKRSLLIADQKKYIESFYHYSFIIIRNILQILVLILTKNFILYLFTQIIFTLLENLTISKKVDKMYPLLLKNKGEKLDKKEKMEIIKNVKAMISHKLGGVVVTGTDNILISKFIGLVEVGLYSNYILIITVIKEGTSIIFQSIKSGIGNLGVTESIEKNIFIFKCTDLAGFWIFSFASISLLNLFNPFISLWLGSGFVFSMPIVVLIVINFYLIGRRQSVLTFRDAYGLFWYDRYKPFFEVGINLIVSLILVKYIGIGGIILGTIISTLTTCFWIEPYILYKYGFKNSPKEYFMNFIKYGVLTISSGYITVFLCNIFIEPRLINFIYKVVICSIVPNLIYFLIFRKTLEFQYLKNMIKLKSI